MVIPPQRAYNMQHTEETNNSPLLNRARWAENSSGHVATSGHRLGLVRKKQQCATRIREPASDMWVRNTTTVRRNSYLLAARCSRDPRRPRRTSRRTKLRSIFSSTPAEVWVLTVLHVLTFISFGSLFISPRCCFHFPPC